MTQKATPQKNSSTMRFIVIGLLVVGAFFAAYKFATALNGSGGETALAATGSAASALGAAGSGAPSSGGSTAANAAPGTSSSTSGGSGCACCGGGSGSSTPVQGTATQSGSVQKISIDTSSGSYNPNVIKLKAGVPAELTFGQASGCLGQVVSQDLGFSEDLTSGAKTVKLAALKAGTYSFSCGMGMVYGSVVVQ